MEPEMSGILASGPGMTRTTRNTGYCSGEAAKPSRGSGLSSALMRVSQRRVKAEGRAPVPDGTAGFGPVLRKRTVRGSVAPKQANRANEPKEDVRTMTPKNPPRQRRGRPADTLCKSKDATGTVEKIPTAKKASLRTPRSKLSKSSTGKQRPSTRASYSTPPSVCKTESEAETLSFGLERGTLKGKGVKERPRRHLTLKQTDSNKEESEEEDEENEIKAEEVPEISLKLEDEVGEEAEPPRKRGRRRKDDKTPRLPKKRKKPPVQYVRCEMEGCGTVLAHPRYLQHHIKYQHLLKKKYACNHPSCGRLFRLQKQLLRHAKHHTDQRDYICEYCARAFKSSYNLAVHRMIHTGEKPIQCEICGFTCRQKASLNWHMKKHDAETFYQFSCSICGKKFEKKDCVVAHKAKSHPEVVIAEAQAVNTSTLPTSPTPVLEAVSGVAAPAQPPVSEDNQGAITGAHIPLQQAVPPLAPQTQLPASPSQLQQLSPPHMVQVKQEQETTTLLCLTNATTSAAQLSSPSQPQLIQLTNLPLTTVTTAPTSTADFQTTLLTLSSVATFTPTATLIPHQTMDWAREDGMVPQPDGEGVLWERVVVGEQQNTGEMVWQGDVERGKKDGGMVWGSEVERQMLLGSVDVHGDSLI
ncbi:E3 ubiquitin-protein ligase ZFP91-like [Lampris incognitus]|uniref:E3 ubiquitin-protein ligase ZFP91-like n=1 Tax=Lampris incognitus TaxID=2546036 RepID=UPI0024B5F7C6|nr:E3 ubiquitin-protein ligase ZFP91-like [Lampris incognitus]XP_056156390.1 E3 ubiquitin-protein ligase ZFP91-like [Lampris incognitus]